MDEKRRQELISIYKKGLLEDTVPFWTNHSVDHEYGGFLTFLDRDGSLYGTDKPVWLQGRSVWLFSRLYNEVEKKSEWLEIAKQGLDFLLKNAFDSDGRMFFLLTRDGKPLRKRRYVYAEVFAVMGMAEYARATGNDEIRQRAIDLYDLLLRYHRTPGLLPPKGIPETRRSKSHSMPMILINTTHVIKQVDDRPVYNEVIDDSIHQVLNHFAKPELKALLEIVGPNGERLEGPEGRQILPGHAIESAWFITEEGRQRKDRGLIDAALSVMEWSLERGWDKEFGGLLYYTDLEDRPCVQYEWDLKLWWPHTEALYALLFAYHLTGDPKWEEWYNRVHDYSFSHFPDPEYGEWFGYLHRDGTLLTRLKGNLWKGPYHLGRMQINCWKILEETKAAF